MIYTRAQYQAAKRYGHAHGYKGRAGGWIYDAGGNAISQGWSKFFWQMPDRIRRWTAAECGADWNSIIDSEPSYRPTIRPRTPMHAIFAGLYDDYMRQVGSEKRAFRGLKYEQQGNQTNQPV